MGELYLLWQLSRPSLLFNYNFVTLSFSLFISRLSNLFKMPDCILILLNDEFNTYSIDFIAII